MAGGEAGPRAQVAGGGEAAHVVDLGHEHRAEHRAHPGDGLDRGEAGVAGQGGPHLGVGRGHLPVVDLDQVPQGLDPDGVGPPEGDLVQQALAGHPEQVGHGHGHPLLGQHGMDLGLEPRAQADQLGPVADQLPQLRGGRRGDVGLGQAAQAEHGDEVGGVDLVVLHPSVPPVEPEGMGQVDGGPEVLEDVDGPVPAVGRLEDHLGVLAGLGHLGGQGDGVVVDVHGGEVLAGLVGAHDHAPVPVQVDAEVLSLRFHGGLPPSSRARLGSPECRLDARSPATAGGPHQPSPSSSPATISPQAGQQLPGRSRRQNRLQSGQRRSSTNRSSQPGHSYTTDAVVVPITSPPPGSAPARRSRRARHAGAALRSFIPSGGHAARARPEVRWPPRPCPPRARSSGHGAVLTGHASQSLPGRKPTMNSAFAPDMEWR